MITFKKATLNDISVLALLGRITYTESHGHFITHKTDLLAYLDNAFATDKIKKDIEDSNNLFYIASINNLPVAYAKISLNTPFENKTEITSCRLERIYVLEHFLHQKIGQPFLDYLINNAKSYKATSMWLSVYIKNERGIKFYYKNNFKEIGKLNFLVNEKTYDNFVLSKKI